MGPVFYMNIVHIPAIVFIGKGMSENSICLLVAGGYWCWFPVKGCSNHIRASGGNSDILKTLSVFCGFIQENSHVKIDTIKS